MLMLMFFSLSAWTIEVVAADTASFSLPIIALDSSGNPYLLVSKKRIVGANRSLYYLFLYSKTAGIWAVDTLELNADQVPFTHHYDLAIDRFNRIWCVYSAFDDLNNTDYLIVSRKDSSDWKKDTVEVAIPNNTYDFNEQSIATDAMGVPHIAYEHMIDGWRYGFYAYLLEDTIWQKEMIDTVPVGCYHCSICLDSQNTPHISYFHCLWDTGGPHDNLSYAYKESGIWCIEEIDSAHNISQTTTSIAIGPNDLPGIAYTDPTTYQLKYAYYDGLVWWIDIVDFSGWIGTQKSIDIDSLGEPCFIYSRSDEKSWFAYRNTTGWHKERLPLPPSVTKGFEGSLRIGKDGTIHIARLATNDDYTYREIHYIYGTIVGIEEGERLKVEGEGLKLVVLPSVVRDNAKIQYTIPERQRISLDLYDILGRKVKTIAQGIVKSGFYSYRLNSSDFSSRVYFLILEGKKEAEAEKLLIVK
ncbi:MAG: hypothetical protein ABIL39_04790 [candidate division WOR-3 bacterium]